MGWSEKYKKSIDCNNPKGFSQRAHCQGRRKKLKEQLKPFKTVEQIAKKHRLNVSFIQKQLDMGEPIEHEHTKDHELAREIALQHLSEIPDYYTRLKKMEADAKKEHKKFKDVSVSEGTLHHWYQGSSGKTKTGKTVKGWVQPDGSPCANEPGETKTPKCFSSARLTSLKSKGEEGESIIKSAVRRKRQKDKSQQAKSGAAAPTNVPTFAKGKKDPNYVKAEPGIKEEMELNEAVKDKPGKGSGSKDACYHKVKSRYDVWPSAYASGALVKCRRVGASNWGNKSESLSYDWDTPIRERADRYCPKCQKLELRNECKYGPKYWDMFSLPAELISSKKDFNTTMPHPGNFPESYDHEYSMARSELSTIISAAKRLRKKMKGEGNIEAWVQSKITKAADYIDSAADYVESGEHNVDEAKKCWSGYEKKGTQKLFGKTYNRCVKKEEYSNWRDELIISEKWEDKLKNMTPEQIENLKKSNPGAAEKIDAMRKQAKSATPKPVGSGSQLPSVPKSQVTQNRGQNTRAQSSYDRMSAARRQGSQNVAAAQAKRAAKIAAKPSLLKVLSKVKNPKVAIPLAIAGGIYGLLTSPKKQQKEEYSNWREELLEQKGYVMPNASKRGAYSGGDTKKSYKVGDTIPVSATKPKTKLNLKSIRDAGDRYGKSTFSEDWQSANRKDGVDGLSQSTVDKYRKEHPGSKLQTAVTEKKPKGKRAKRRANFCRRMKGMKSKLTSAKTARDPDSRINKALRRWNCN